MKSVNLYNSKIFKFFDYVFRIVLINLLIIIPSFLLLYLFNIFFKDLPNFKYWSYLTLIPTILYIYPAICAGIDLVSKFELKLCNTVFKEFFKSFKKVYKKAIIETIFLVIFILLFYNSIIYFYTSLSEGLINIIGLILSISFSIMLLCIVIHLPLVMSYMSGCRIIDDIKLATMMAFKDLAITLALVVTIVVIAYLSIMYDTILIIGGFGLPIYLVVRLTFKKYYIIYVRAKGRKENKGGDEK